ncbi:MAG: hypothetical protein LBN00_02370 [Oscillospiraceae bacterium]|jgi:hypothetical protein|nr:hypothetical protein [Oscillospiraceae bacterium]
MMEVLSLVIGAFETLLSAIGLLISIISLRLVKKVDGVLLEQKNKHKNEDNIKKLNSRNASVLSDLEKLETMLGQNDDSAIASVIYKVTPELYEIVCLRNQITAIVDDANTFKVTELYNRFKTLAVLETDKYQERFDGTLKLLISENKAIMKEVIYYDN